MSVEDQFLAKLARGQWIAPEEYDQISQDLPPALLAAALAKRFDCTGDTRFLIEAARLYTHAGFLYEALEAASRSPRVRELQRVVLAALPQVRRDYPNTRLVGKLVADAFLVIDLDSGSIARFPDLM